VELAAAFETYQLMNAGFAVQLCEVPYIRMKLVGLIESQLNQKQKELIKEKNQGLQ